MRDFKIKARFAQEFSGFSGSPKTFRSLSEDLGITPDGGRFWLYSAKDVRLIRLKLLKPNSQGSNSHRIPPILNFRMTKGGTGKTTIAGNVASTLAMMGYRILMIDGDPQASLTSLFGIDWVSEEITHIGELMRRYCKKQSINIERAIFPIYADSMLDLIPADITLADADSWLMAAMNREAMFKCLLNMEIAFFSTYDAIVIDSAPGTTLLTNTLMFACNTLIAVVWLDGQSIEAMRVLASNVTELNNAFASTGFHLDVHIVANGLHQGYQSCKEALATLHSVYPNQMNDNAIPHSASFMRQMNLFERKASGPVLEREPASVGTRAIIDLTKSLIKKYDIQLSGSMEATKPVSPISDTSGK